MKKQTLNKSVTLFIVFYLLNILLSCSAFNASSSLDIDLIPDSYNVSSGQDFNLTLFLFPKQENLNVNSLTININFDKEKLTFKKAILESKNKNTKLKSTCSDGTVSLDYTNKDGTSLKFGSQAKIFKLKFYTKALIEGSTEIVSKIDGVYDKNNNQINTSLDLKAISLNLLPPDTSNCLLSSLVPSEGTLCPNFNPNIYKYEINVPYSIKDIYLSFNTVNSGVTTKINRHKLSAAGKSTNINIIVYDKKEKSKLIYTITVKRGAKPDKNKTKKHKTKTTNKKFPEYISDNNIDSSDSSEDKAKNIEPNFVSKNEEDIPLDSNTQSQDTIEANIPTDINNSKGTVYITSSSKNNIVNNKLLILCLIITIALFSYSLYIILHSVKNIFSGSKININHNIYLD